MASVQLSAVAFDLDGTLYPNYRLNTRLLPFLLRHWRFTAAFGKARGIIRREQEHCPSFSSPDFYGYQAQVTAGLLNAPPDQVGEKIERLIYRGWEPHFKKIKLFPYVRELLDALRAAGLRLGMLSDFPPLAKLEHLGLAGYWDAALCSETTGALKPAGKPFEELAAALGCPPQQILYVGNSRPYDVAGARRAGMKTALIASRFACGRIAKDPSMAADFTFHDYRQLRDFVLQ